MASDNTLERLARLGYGARGLVYCMIGGLAFAAAIGSGGETGGSRNALATLVDEPFGKVLLGIMALGLAGFSAWRFLDAIIDADHRGTSKRGLAERAGHFVSGILYAGLAFYALSLATGWNAVAVGGGGSGSGASGGGAQGWTAQLMAQPFGRWLVAIVGLVVLGAAIGFIAKGWSGHVTRRLAYPPQAGSWIVPLGRAGTIARGVVFFVIGGALLVAAWQADSSEARGLGGALRILQEQPYGWVLLAVVAAGLIAFGAFGFVQARYRRIDAPDMDDAGHAAKRQAHRMG